jgi:ribosomal protein S18 acetylase RimI-like enzyme
MPIEVREATPEEHERAGEVTAQAYHEFAEGDDWYRYLGMIADVASRADRTTILVAVDEGRILGSATLELTERTENNDEPLRPEESHIRMLGVAPDARRRGVARDLMLACIARARDAGKTFMTLHTTPMMGAAQRMYESLGFVRGDDRVFPDGFVLLSYRKELGDP